MIVQDFVINGQGHGEVAEQLQGLRFDPNLMRPYFDENGRKCVTVNTGRKEFDAKKNLWLPVYEKYTLREMDQMGIDLPLTANATTLRKDEWVQMDQKLLLAARARLRAWSDLAAVSPYGGFNGMAKTVLEEEAMSDPGEAIVDMDGLTEGRTDSPLYSRAGLPLPITHGSFWFDKRRLMISRNSGTPLNTSMAEAIARRIAEKVERTLIGTETGLAFGASTEYVRTSQVYGYTNFAPRNTKTDLTTPTGSNPEATVTDVLEMLDLAYADNRFGPFMLYHSTNYTQFMDNDYARLGGNNASMTLRDRLRKIDGIQDVRRLDFLTSGYQLILVQMTSDVAEAVNGMDLTTIQWESHGGMKVNFKVMAIYVPRLKADYNGTCGIVHGTTS